MGTGHGEATGRAGHADKSHDALTRLAVTPINHGCDKTGLRDSNRVGIAEFGNDGANG